jgi:hypothetical protein
MPHFWLTYRDARRGTPARLDLGEFEVELVLEERSSVIGKANDVESALNLMDEAMWQYPRSHIRLRRGTSIIVGRVTPGEPR